MITRDPCAGGLFRYLNANKRSIECDPGSAAGKAALFALVQGADLVVENLGPGVLEGFGVGWNWLEQGNPKIALIRISDYGQTGPYSNLPGTDLTVQATANWVSNHHTPSQMPVQAGGRIADFTAGAYAPTAALTALSIASAGGKAISVDVSKQECLTSCIGAVWLHVEKLQAMGWGIPAERYFPLPGVVRCKDGLVSINALTGQHFIDCCNLLGVPKSTAPSNWKSRKAGQTLMPSSARSRPGSWSGPLKKSWNSARRCASPPYPFPMEKRSPISHRLSLCDSADRHLCASADRR